MFKHDSQGSTLVKTITIRDEIYKKLLTLKKENESFSELFDRLAENKDPKETLTKLRARVEFTNKEAMLTEIYSSRAEQRR
jgi:predicted CopG family antitoxin